MCSVTLDRKSNNGKFKMKMVNQYKNSFKKETDFDNIVDQLCSTLQDIKEKESGGVNVHMRTLEQSEAVRRYYAAFPALEKGEQSPLQYYLPPPVWCHKTAIDNCKYKMQSNTSMTKELNQKNKKFFGKERRNSYTNCRKSNRKYIQSYSKSYECKENLPEWVTHEGVWDIETQDPVREFIRAIALDEGYGTCENTFTDDIKDSVNVKMDASKVPDWDDSLDLDTEWIITEDLKPHIRTPMEEEIFAKFEAKFDRSIEALWTKEQANTPDDEYQDLPIDFQDLLSSPSDNQFFDPVAEKSSLISLTESIWSNDAYDSMTGAPMNCPETPTKSIEKLHDRFKPLKLADDVSVAKLKSPNREVEPFSLYSYEGIYEAVPSVSDIMRSLTAINHSKNHSSFTEVIPRKHSERKGLGDAITVVPKTESRPAEAESDVDDPLTSPRTHFRPIRKEATTVASRSDVVRYNDGDTFDIKGEIEHVKFHRSKSGFIYLASETESPKRYLEYRATGTIDYSRLNLTEAQRKGNDMEDDQFRLKFAVRQMEKAIQTEEIVETVQVYSEERGADVWRSCEECGRTAGAKKMRQSGIDSIWTTGEGEDGSIGVCRRCGPGIDAPIMTHDDEFSRDWEELLADIAAAHTHYAAIASAGLDRKRRHSAALRCPRRHAPCRLPHAPFLPCTAADRPLTR